MRPLLPLVAAARRRGHDVAIVGPAGLRAMVESAGFPFRAGGEPPEDEVAPIREQLAVAAPEVASALANGELFGRMATGAMLAQMEATCASFRPDLVLREPCEYSSAVVAAERNLAHAQAAISLAEVEDGSLTVAAPVLEERRPGLVTTVRASPYLTRMPATLDPSSFPVTVRLREPTEPATGPAPAPWASDGGPLVYMTFGTVLGYMSMASAVYRKALEVAAQLPASVVLSVGRVVDISALGPFPRNVRVEAWVDHAQALGHADVCVCHGGSGTVFDALAAGVPVVVVPLFADQFANGRAVARAGAGTIVEPDRDATRGGRPPVADLDAAAVAKEVGRVMGEASYRRRAGLLATEMASGLGVDDVLERLLTGEIGPSHEHR